MSDEKPSSGLQKIDLNEMLPIGFDQLPEDKKLALIEKLQIQDIELRRDLKERVYKSRNAEHDLSVAVETVRKLSDEKKIYTEHVKGETGSGTYDLKIRGGDTKFIVPILLVIGLIIIAVIALMS